MIEVEIRGQPTKEGFKKLKEYMKTNGEHIESHEREMILLYDYPGYDHDPLKRETDIRLRCTNGKSEIMVKKKASDNNTGRKEISLKLADDNLETAKEVMRAFGCDKGLWMHRKKDVYRYKGVEWSLVETPKEYFFFEAEKEVDEEEDLEEVRKSLVQNAEEIGLEVFSPEDMREFLYMLDREVNKEIEL